MLQNQLVAVFTVFCFQTSWGGVKGAAKGEVHRNLAMIFIFQKGKLLTSVLKVISQSFVLSEIIPRHVLHFFSDMTLA